MSETAAALTAEGLSRQEGEPVGYARISTDEQNLDLQLDALHRLGRGLKHLIEAIEELHDRGIGVRSLTEQIDTTTSAGRLQFHIFGALAEFEREIIRERTRAGLAAARARGRIGGRPRALTAEKLAGARAMRERKHTMPEIAKALGVSRATLYRRLALDEQTEAAA